MALYRVILLPGSVLPAELAYGSLVTALASDCFHAHDPYTLHTRPRRLPSRQDGGIKAPFHP